MNEPAAIDTQNNSVRTAGDIVAPVNSAIPILHRGDAWE